MLVYILVYNWFTLVLSIKILKLLFHNNQAWKKKSGDPHFDVPIGCYDEAETNLCSIIAIHRYISGNLYFEQNKVLVCLTSSLGHK